MRFEPLQAHVGGFPEVGVGIFGVGETADQVGVDKLELLGQSLGDQEEGILKLVAQGLVGSGELTPGRCFVFDATRLSLLASRSGHRTLGLRGGGHTRVDVHCVLDAVVRVLGDLGGDGRHVLPPHTNRVSLSPCSRLHVLAEHRQLSLRVVHTVGMDPVHS